jgi:tetratricopeptide (TPR) repeat protein
MLMTWLRDLTPKQQNLFVAAVTFLVWSPSLLGGFAWDDTNNLVDNARLQGWPALIEVFRHDAMWSAKMDQAVIATYRPLSLASFVIDYQLFRGHAFGYHLSSVLWHALTTVVVFNLLKRFMAPLEAVAVTLFWAIHPIHNEAVAWINGRSEIFALLFGALAALAATGRPLRGVTGLRELVVTACLLLAMLGKESGAVFAGVAVLLSTQAPDLEGRGVKARVLRGVVVALAGICAFALYGWVRSQVLTGGAFPGVDSGLGNQTLKGLSSGAAILLKCLQALLVPIDLSVTYLYLWAGALTATQKAVAWGSLALLSLVALSPLLRKRWVPTFMLLWWLASVLPVVPLALRDWPGFSRWLYLGGPGLWAGLYLLVRDDLPARPLRVFAAAVAAIFFVQTQRGIQIWKDSGTLWSRMVIEQPYEPYGWLSLAAWLDRQGDYVGAERAALRTGELKPRGHDPWGILADAQARQGRCAEATQTATVDYPAMGRFGWLQSSIGYCWEKAGDKDKALEFYRKCEAELAYCKARITALAPSVPPSAPAE